VIVWRVAQPWETGSRLPEDVREDSSGLAAQGAPEPDAAGRRDRCSAGFPHLERVDGGGFSTVYRAFQENLGRTVALKILKTDELDDRPLKRFRNECLASGRLSAHPNIVTVYDAGVTPGRRPYIAMEYGVLRCRVAGATGQGRRAALDG
jgi:hypothetical protein